MTHEFVKQSHGDASLARKIFVVLRNNDCNRSLEFPTCRMDLLRGLAVSTAGHSLKPCTPCTVLLGDAILVLSFNSLFPTHVLMATFYVS